MAFYPKLGIKVRTTEYKNRNEMYQYISGLRMCDTPYVAFDTFTNIVLDKEVYDLGGEEMAKMLEEQE